MTLIAKTEIEGDGGNFLFTQCKFHLRQLNPSFQYVMHGALLQGLLEPAREMKLTHARSLRHVLQPEMIANVTIDEIVYSAKSRSAQAEGSHPVQRSIPGGPLTAGPDLHGARAADRCTRGTVA